VNNKRINYNELKIKITDELDNPILDFKGNSKKIKSCLEAIDLKYNGRKK
jgi:hypothetical protein